MEPINGGMDSIISKETCYPKGDVLKYRGYVLEKQDSCWGSHDGHIEVCLYGKCSGKLVITKMATSC